MWHIPSRNIKRIDVDSISSPSKIHYIPESVENNSINSENIHYYKFRYGELFNESIPDNNVFYITLRSK